MDRKRKCGLESSCSKRMRQTNQCDLDERTVIVNEERSSTRGRQGNHVWSNRPAPSSQQNHGIRQIYGPQRPTSSTTTYFPGLESQTEFFPNHGRMGDVNKWWPNFKSHPVSHCKRPGSSSTTRREFQAHKKKYNSDDISQRSTNHQKFSQNRTYSNSSRKRVCKNQFQSTTMKNNRNKVKKGVSGGSRQRNIYANEKRFSSSFRRLSLEYFGEIKHINDFQDGDFEDFKSLFDSMTSFRTNELQLLMSVLSTLLQEQNTELCETLMENNFFDREEIRIYVSEIISRSKHMNISDIKFVKNSTRVLVALTLEPKTKASKVLSFLNMIILIVRTATEQDQHTVLSKIPRAFLQDIKERWRSNSNTGTFSDILKEELYTMIHFEILPNSTAVRNKIVPNLRPRQLDRASATRVQYLVEQFYLFLEDFIGPLREGIQNYLNYAASVGGGTKGKFKDENIRLYEKVHILERKCIPNAGIVIEVQFDTKGWRGVQWDNSDFLKYGNVVCLTHEDSDTLLYALIADRNWKHLNDGKISLSLVEDNFLPAEEMLNAANGKIVMLESKAFYTAYRHTLEALKATARKMYIDFEYTGIPFSEHIVELKTYVEEPLYSHLKYDEERLVNFNCLLDNEDRKDYSKVSLLNLNAWPSSRELGMDEQQYYALQLCLTKKLGILQGPPGTGKTWMGLRILEFLLNNDLGFEHTERKPILLLSYTNHALDQIFNALFDMESLLKLFSAGGNPFVRVGSRSIVERIQKCTLAEHRKQQKARKSKIHMEKIMNLKQEIFEIEVWLDKVKNSIFSPSFLYKKECMIESHKHSLYSNEQIGALNDVDVIYRWLELGSCRQTVQFATTQTFFQGDAINKHSCVDEDEEFLRSRSLSRIVEDADDYALNKEVSFSNIISKLALSEELLLPGQEKNVSPVWKCLNRGERKKVLEHVRIRLRLDSSMSTDEEQNVADVWCLSIDERWRLYKAWIRKLQVLLEQQKKNLMQEFEKENKNYMSEKRNENTMIISNCSIVGMTTTGAAQNLDLLRKVQPRIVVVEEAAQVFEQHIIGCLTEGLQHLILIGDHQQLRPPINNYSLSKSHKTDVSMMERLVLNGLPYVCLSQQHRMRPEISSLLTPTIYKVLRDHPNVTSYEHIQGFQHDVYFLDHVFPESQTEFSTSHKNEFEAEMILKMYRYLLFQGYSRDDITILSTYNDQVKLIRKYLKAADDSLPKVNDGEKPSPTITAVDNFQGEENVIILLSLVRGNNERKIGHLHDIKRICVSLSRAKRGFFVLGNFQTIRKSETWNKIISKAESNGIFGTYLPLRCVNHPNTITKVSKPSDFDLVPIGGCIEPCGFQRNCGHVCNLKCHPVQSHHDTPCRKICEKNVCDNGHKCERECSHPMPCGPCKVQMPKVFPKCKHEVKVACSTDLDTIHCQEPCNKQYQCGHPCTQPCGVSCSPEQCSVNVPEVHPRCSHEIKVPCCDRNKLYEAKCFVKCSSKLPCGHVCKGDCFSCLSGRLHILCSEICERVLVCGHSCKSKHPCSSACPPCGERCPSGCEHLGKRGCPKTCGQKCTDCREPCVWMCDKGCKNNYRCEKQCFEECTRQPCNNRCRKRLTCRHRCVGLCGEQCPTLCKRCNKEELTSIFFGNEDEPSALYVQLEECGHVFEVTDFDKYMEMETEKNEDSMPESFAIKLIRCPRCQTPIRRGRRYKNVLNRNLQNLNEVKNSMEKERHKETDMDKEKFQKASRYLSSLLPKCHYQLSFSNTNAKNFFTFFVLKFYDNVYGNTKTSLDKNEIMEQFHIILKWILRHKDTIFTEYDVLQFQDELERFFLYVDFALLWHQVESQSQNISKGDRLLIQQQSDKMYWPVPKAEVEEMIQSREILKNMREKIPLTGLGISDDERKMILKAFSYSKKGHWYKCKNGHIYSIGDCGGAMVESKCPECDETIGGGSHRLRSDNQVAGEMDGATFAAWSEQANMANYGDL